MMLHSVTLPCLLCTAPMRLVSGADAVRSKEKTGQRNSLLDIVRVTMYNIQECNPLSC